MFRETAFWNHEKFCESIRRKRLPIATPESVKRPHKTKKISVAEQITRSVEKLCINSQSSTTNHHKKAKKKLDLPEDDFSNSISIENNSGSRESFNLKTFLEKLDSSIEKLIGKVRLFYKRRTPLSCWMVLCLRKLWKSWKQKFHFWVLEMKVNLHLLKRWQWLPCMVWSCRVETSSPQHYKECIQHLLSEVMRIIWWVLVLR